MSTNPKAHFKPIVRQPPPALSSKSPSPPVQNPTRDRKRNRNGQLPPKTKQPFSNTPIEEEPSSPTFASLQSHEFTPKSETSIANLATVIEVSSDNENPKVIVERPTPERGRSTASTDAPQPEALGQSGESDTSNQEGLRPSLAARRHSPISDSGDRLFSALYRARDLVYRPTHARMSSRTSGDMKSTIRKIWVKRTGSSPTQVAIGEDDLVDDVRDMILRKYANSLGRTFDSPDVTLRLVQRRVSARHSNHERILGPEEVISKLIEIYYPGGQTVEEALIIDVPQRRTPKHSPRIALPYYMSDHLRPGENGGDYFPPMSIPAPHSPSISSHPASIPQSHRSAAHAIAVLETGQVPDVPSPGSRITRHSHRPRNPRTHTSSPTVVSGSSNLSNHGWSRSKFSNSKC